MKNIGYGFESSPLFLAITGIGGASVVGNFLSRGEYGGAAVSAILAAVITGGLSAWTGGHQRYLDEQSARIRSNLAEGRQPNGNKAES